MKIKLAGRLDPVHFRVAVMSNRCCSCCVEVVPFAGCKGSFVQVGSAEVGVANRHTRVKSAPASSETQRLKNGIINFHSGI